MGWFGMNFDPLSFAIGKHGDSGPVRDVVSYLIGRAASAAGGIWQTITNVTVATFTAVSSTLRELVIDVTPLQSGSGDPSPTNVRPISGWTGANLGLMGKNLLGGILAANRIAEGASSSTIDESAKTIAFDTVGEDGTLLLTNDRTQGAKFFPFKPSMSYTIIGRLSKTGSGTSFGLGVIYTDGTSYRVQTSDIDSDGYLVFTTNASKTVRGIFAGYQLVNGQLLYYDTFGIYESVVAKADAAPYLGTTIPVSWQTEAGTVYGGTLDVTTGVLTVTHVISDLGDKTWYAGSASDGVFYTRVYENVIKKPASSSALGDYYCSALKQGAAADFPTYASYTDNMYLVSQNERLYAKLNDTITTADAFATAVAGIKFVYELATPTTAQLTPTEVKTLLGENNIFADCGNINTITFRTN